MPGREAPGGREPTPSVRRVTERKGGTLPSIEMSLTRGYFRRSVPEPRNGQYANEARDRHRIASTRLSARAAPAGDGRPEAPDAISFSEQTRTSSGSRRLHAMRTTTATAANSVRRAGDRPTIFL